MEIKGAEDFGLAFNCMTRLYVWSHKESILDDMLLVLRRYVSFFSIRTIVCSLRDFIDKVPFYDSDDILDSQLERCEQVWKLLVRQGLTLDRERNLHKHEDVLICDFGRNIYFCNSPFENTGWTQTEFLTWVRDNQLEKPTTVNIVDRNDCLPLDKDFLPVFYRVCYYMYRYSYGRQTYMPNTCCDFVKANIDLFPDNILKQCIKDLREDISTRSEGEGYLERFYDDIWEAMLQYLESELTKRQVHQ